METAESKIPQARQQQTLDNPEKGEQEDGKTLWDRFKAAIKALEEKYPE